MHIIKGRFTLWPWKSRGRGIEWPNFVENPKEWAENSQYNIVIGAFGRAWCEASKGQA
jgi:hypothetical protein